MAAVTPTKTLGARLRAARQKTVADVPAVWSSLLMPFAKRGAKEVTLSIGELMDAFGTLDAARRACKWLKHKGNSEEVGFVVCFKAFSRVVKRDDGDVTVGEHWTVKWTGANEAGSLAGDSEAALLPDSPLAGATAPAASDVLTPITRRASTRKPKAAARMPSLQDTPR